MNSMIMKLLFSTILAAALFVAGAEAQAGLQEGIIAYKNGDYRAALKHFKPLASKGDMAAQNSLGDMYANGHGVPQDYKQAEIWYRKASEQGYAIAQYNLGSLYHNGLGVPQDYKQAAIWYKKSAEQSARNLHMNIGEAQAVDQASKEPKHETDKFEVPAKVSEAPMKNQQAEIPGIDAAHLIAKRETIQSSRQDEPQGQKILEDAAASFRSAAEQGNADAQFNLGLMYDNGQGVAQNYKEAAMWYRKAAEQGNAKAQVKLAKMYIKGHGVAYDYQQAVKWFSKAAEQGSVEASKQKDLLKR